MINSPLKSRVPQKFGLLVPKENNIYWIKQGGGFSCIQHELEGVYIPIGKMKHNLGYPDWSPEGPNFEEKIIDLDISSLSDGYRDEIPDAVLERGSFKSLDQYFQWIEDSEFYGWINLWDDLRRFTYGIFENLESDPRERWNSRDELWETIDERLGFEYERLEYSEYRADLNGDYPRPQSAIRPIKITEVEDKSKHKDWSALVNQVVFLLCPNAD